VYFRAALASAKRGSQPGKPRSIVLARRRAARNNQINICPEGGTRLRYQIKAQGGSIAESPPRAHNSGSPPMKRRYSKVVVDLSETTHVIPDDLVQSDPQKVLMLEDDPVMADTLKVFLETCDFRVTHVTSGAEGVKKILAVDFDIILCDMIMPGFPGDMFYRAVERVRPHLCKRFIFTTGHRGDSQIDAFIRGVRGLMLWKPFQFHELLAAIKTVQRKTALTA